MNVINLAVSIDENCLVLEETRSNCNTFSILPELIETLREWLS